MYLYLGQAAVIRQDDIIGIFDLDNATVSKHTRDYLSAKEKEKRVVNVSFELPRSFLVTAKPDGADEEVYISQLSPATLQKRVRSITIKEQNQ